MKINTYNAIYYFVLSSLALLVSSISATAAPVVVQVSGANPAAIQTGVDQFRADLGGANNGVGSSFTSGRREINWDGVPDSFAEPNNFPRDFFNVNSPRGVVFNTIEDATGTGLNQFAVSATTASGTAVRFGNQNANYATIFQTFSAQRLFIARNTHILEVTFFIPGTHIPATVAGFGSVFTDVDSATGGDSTTITYYAADGSQLLKISAPVANNGLSFAAASFNAGERVARVIIESGNAALSSANNDGVNGVDAVAMDDFIYGEPRASEHHESDFDGDGTADFAVFRPSVGSWFILNSGSNTLSAVQFGANGDLPVDGDFDGDGRNDLAVFRPATGEWFILNSSNDQFIGVPFGSNGDKPVAGDYDKDGKTDIAVWRPASGNYFFLKSSNGQFGSVQFGQNGDIPIGAALVP